LATCQKEIRKKFRVSLPKNCRSRFDNSWKHHEKGLKLPPKTKAMYGSSPIYSIKSLESDKWPHCNYLKSLFMKLVKIVSWFSICSLLPSLLTFCSFLFVYLTRTFQAAMELHHLLSFLQCTLHIFLANFLFKVLSHAITCVVVSLFAIICEVVEE
jgi:hypothetical protein